MIRTALHFQTDNSPKGSRSQLPRVDYGSWGFRLFQNTWYRDARFSNRILTLLSLKPGYRVLDIGCGDGSLLADIANHGASVVGVDSSREMTDLASKRCTEIEIVTIRHGRFEDLASTLGYFDAVVCKNILHVIADLTNFFGGIRRVLRPTGRLVVAETVSPTVSANGFVRELFRRAGLAPAKAHYFRKNDVREFIEEEGFEVQRTEFYPQEIILSEWLGAKNAGQQARIVCHRWVESAPADVKEAMQISRFGSNGRRDWRLLRLQFLASCLPRSVS